MIVAWIAVTVYALAYIIHVYEKYDRLREKHLRAQVTREARDPVQALPLPLPEPVPVEEPSWLISHDQVLRSLSPSLVRDFQSQPPQEGRLQASHLISPSEYRVSEANEVPGSRTG